MAKEKNSQIPLKKTQMLYLSKKYNKFETNFFIVANCNILEKRYGKYKDTQAIL